MDILRGELERLFSLDELTALCRDVLGLDPETVGGTATKASFARALADVCARVDAVDALVDAVLASRTDADAKLRDAGGGAKEELAVGTSVGEHVVSRKIGEGPLGIVYAAKKGGAAATLKVFSREATRDRRATQRYLAHARLAAKVEHDGLAKGLAVGSTGSGDDPGRCWAAYAHFDGQPLASRISRTGPMHINEARPVLKAILEALGALHDARLAHGNLKLENVLLVRGEGGQRPVLVDLGEDRLRIHSRAGDAAGAAIALGAAKSLAPEQIGGNVADAKSDLYAFGAMTFEILTGKPVFAGASPVEVAFGHVAKEPPAPSTVGPRGWVSPEVDALVLSLLKKDPSARPASAAAVIEALEAIGRPAAKKAEVTITAEDVDARIAALAAAPDDHEAGLKLEAAVDEGAEAAKVAEAFATTARAIEIGEGEEAKRESRKSLLFRAARLFERAKASDEAEKILAEIVALDPADEIASTKLEDLRKALGKFEELVEMLLARAEAAATPEARARAMAEIGRIYAHDLEDKAQAVVAYAQAFCDDPKQADYADELEKAAGSDQALWGEAITALAAATQTDLAVESKNVLFDRLARWYEGKLGRPDAALPCYQAVVATDPANDAALVGMAGIYKKAQQWPELGAVLLRRADAAATPGRARELRVEAAELLETRLNDHARARDLYQHVVDEDPANEKATAALGRILERAGDFAGFVKLLERGAEALRGDEKANALARIAEVYEDQLNDLATAVFRFESILTIDEKNMAALKGLDRIYSKQGKYRELLAVLEREVVAAATPRQKITLHERIAGVWEEEFLDHAKAAEAAEAILAIDSSNESALTALARHYRSLDRWEDVSHVYERHLKMTSDDARRVELCLAHGRVLAEQIGSPERARNAYEKVLEVDPEHAAALEALAHLREISGDAVAALEAIEALAMKASTPEAKAEQWTRAAKLLEGRGDKDGAIARYRRALDANPRDLGASHALRQAYAARGDAAAAVELIAREVEQVEGAMHKAHLLGELARLAKDRLKDAERARTAALAARELDPTNLDALVVLSDVAFEAGRFLEAATHLESLVGRADSLPQADAARAVVRYVDALVRGGGSTEKALAAVDVILRVAGDDPEALGRAARVTFDHGDAKRAYELYKGLLDRFHDRLIGAENSDALYRMGEAARRAGDLKAAERALSEAADMDSLAAEPLIALAKVHEQKGDWEAVVRVKNRRLDVASDDERYQILVEVGDVLAAKIADRTRAAKAFVAALESRPDDRRVLTKLMQLYSEEKDWSKLVDVVLRLAEFNDDPKQKAKYVHTAAIVCAREMGDVDRALGYYDHVIELDGTVERAAEEAIELRRQKGDFPGVERMLKARLDRANASGDRAAMLAVFEQLAELYHKNLQWTADAIDAYEAAQTLDPDNRERNETLAELYASDPSLYLDKAVHAQRAILRKSPFKPESYKLLRKLYTEAKRADAAWCTCQALVHLNLAGPDEERFFARMRAEGPAPAQSVLGDDEWASLLVHEDADPLLTSIFSLVEPVILASRAQSLEALGYQPSWAIDLAADPYPMSQTLHYASSVLGIAAPPTFQNPNDPGGLGFLHAQTPSVVLGRVALAPEVPGQAAAFLVGRHLAYYRPGLYVRHLVPTGTGLRAWLFAAVKLIVPAFPVSAELEGPVQENLAALQRHLGAPAREHLASVVTKLLQSGGSLDLKKWVAAVDLTADRAGFVLAHDLEVSNEVVKASGDDAAAVPARERSTQLVLYSVSEAYFALRTKLGISIDG